MEFLHRLIDAFPFRIQTVQTDNGTDFTHECISEETECPFDAELRKPGIGHVLIPPRTPWQNGKAECGHGSGRRYFCDWEEFRSGTELNEKMKKHPEWSNNKPMLSLKCESPKQMLAEKMSEKSGG